MEKTYQMEGYTLHVIPTQKFKTTTVSLRLQSALTKEFTTIRTLLTFVIGAATRKLPSTKLLATHLDDNYGASLSVHISSKGQSQIMNVFSTFVNENYLPQKESLFEKQIELIHDLFFDPYLVHHAFDEKIVNQKKKELKERLKASQDDKFSYSLDKLFEYMGQDQSLGISSTGYEAEIDAITPRALYQYFIKCIETDEKHFYIVGDVDENMIQILKEKLQFPKQDHHYISSYQFKTKKDEVLEVIEKQDVTQSKLNMGYQIDCDFISEDHYAMTVLNALFGGFSQSRLFQVVREKNSLCYYVSSSYDAFNGIMVVNAGINAQDYTKTKALIQEQLTDIQNGHIEDNEIHIAKIMLQNALRKTNDEASSMIVLSYNRDMTQKKETNEEYIQKLLNVTKEDLIRVSQKVKQDTIFFLTGKDFNENN